MTNSTRNRVLSLVAIAGLSLVALNFSGAATTTPSTAPARHYYLTKGFFNGNQTLNACASGYHFASFAELNDPTVITYNQTLGLSQGDDGAGPPTFVPGWVRSGYISNSNPNLDGNSNVPTNCNLWTSGDTSDDGEVGSFGPSTGTIQVFEAGSIACSNNSYGYNIGVWCMEN